MVNASFGLVPEQSNLRQVTYRVRRGDTLNSVAARWHVQPADIVAWNNLHSHSLFAGQRLNLTVARAPAKPATASASRTAAKKSKGTTAAKPASTAATAGKASQASKPVAARPPAQAAVR
jgi:LysM repeat protein